MPVVRPLVLASYNGVAVAVAAFDVRVVGHFAHQGSHHGLRVVVVVYRAAFGITVAQLAARRQSSCKGTHTRCLFVGPERTVLDAESFDDTADIVKQSQRFTLVVLHIHVADDMSATVVVTLETVGTGTDGDNGHGILHVDVGGLQHIEVTALHQSDAEDEPLQILGGGYLIRFLRRTLAQTAQVQRVVGVHIVA